MNLLTLSSTRQLTALLQEKAIVVLDFYSTDCLPCERLAPIYERLAKQYAMITFIKAYRQEHRDLALSYNVQSSPTILFFHKGILQETRLSGEIQEIDLKLHIDNLLRKEHVETLPISAPQRIEKYDACIIGMGPAGYTASIYAARYHLNHVLVGELEGGLMTSSHAICNYPSEIKISGIDLSRKMLEHARDLHVPMHTSSVKFIHKRHDQFHIVLTNDLTIIAKTVLVATGTRHRHLGIEGEAEFTGRGVSYCATCDAAFFQGKTVAVIGGGDSATTAAIYLADMAQQVYHIHRGTELHGETAWIEQAKNHPKITTLFETHVTKITGTSTVKAIELRNLKNETTSLAVDGVFIEIGSDPDGRCIEQLGVHTDSHGYILTEPDQRTSVPGVWAAGDITTNSNGFRQIITACSEGAIAARSIYYTLKKNK